MKGIRKAMAALKAGKEVYIDCANAAFETEMGTWKQAYHKISKVDDITVKNLEAIAAEEIAVWKSELAAIEEVIDTAEYCKGSYFWSPAGNASSRRWQEEKYTHKAVWREGGHDWTAETQMSQSCRNVYFWTVCMKDGVKTNMRAVKNSYDRLRKAKNDLQS